MRTYEIHALRTDRGSTWVRLKSLLAPIQFPAYADRAEVLAHDRRVLSGVVELMAQSKALMLLVEHVDELVVNL